MATDVLKNRAPAPIVPDTRQHVAYDLHGPQGVMKLPCASPKGTLTLLRFTTPNRANPEGTIVAKGYPPFSPCLIGCYLLPRG